MDEKQWVQLSYLIYIIVHLKLENEVLMENKGALKRTNDHLMVKSSVGSNNKIGKCVEAPLDTITDWYMGELLYMGNSIRVLSRNLVL